MSSSSSSLGMAALGQVTGATGAVAGAGAGACANARAGAGSGAGEGLRSAAYGPSSSAAPAWTPPVPRAYATIPFSSMSRFNLDFRESKPKFLSPNSFSTMADITPTTSLVVEVPGVRKRQ
ncbi:unnamed protein product [Arctogadus glacialis]